MVFRHLNKFDGSGLIPDSKPLVIPVGMRRPPTLAEQVARLVRSHQVADFAASQGKETFEEADDFDIPDDPIDPTTPYEADFDHASINAMDRGIVAPPDMEKAREAASRVADAKKKHKNKLKPKEDPAGAPHVSEDGSSD